MNACRLWGYFYSAPKDRSLGQEISLRLAPCPAAGGARAKLRAECFFATYTPQKTDFNLFAACEPRTL